MRPYLLHKLIVTGLLSILYLAGFAQNPYGEITGEVKSNDGQVISSVTIGIKGSTKVSLSSEKGTFHFKNMKPGNYILKTSYIGLESQEKAVEVRSGESTNVVFELPETAENLKEVVISGYKSSNQKPLAMGKVAIKPLDNPQMVTVISSAVINDQQANRLSDVIKNVNGVALGTTRGTTSETFFARGYSLGANNIFKNGSRASSGAIPEASTLESIEVLKGSAALLYGNVSGGAVINLVTKQPKFDFGGEVSLRAGSYHLYKPTGDIYGPISKKLAFRLIGTYENGESFRQNVKTDRYYVNPSLLYKISDRTSIILQGDYLDYNNTPDFGIGSLSDTQIPTQLPRSSFFNTPWAFNKAKQATVSATLNHQLNKTWKINTIVAHQSYKRDYFSTERIQAAANGDWSRRMTRSKTDERYHNAQINLNGEFNTGKIGHTLLFGVDGENYVNMPVTFKSFNTLYDIINILDPSKYTARTDLPSTTDSVYAKVPTYRFGVYLQDLISISDKWKVLAGLRYSYQKSERSRIYDVNTDEEVKRGAQLNPGLNQDNAYDRVFSPRVGLVYQPISTTSIFLSYANNFISNTGSIDYETGGALRPSIVDQYEVGIKNDFFRGKLSANVSYYKIVNGDFAQTAIDKNTGELVSDATFKEFTGQTTSDGAELDINGNIIRGLNFIAGYSYNYMRYTETSGLSGSYKTGERLVGTTAHTANSTLFYTFSKTRLKGLKLGASAFYTGKRNGGWNNRYQQTQQYSRLIPIGDFTTFDLSAGYNFKKVSLLAKMSNITNELNYYVHENYSVNPIAPRQFMTTLSYKF